VQRAKVEMCLSHAGRKKKRHEQFCVSHPMELPCSASPASSSTPSMSDRERSFPVRNWKMGTYGVRLPCVCHCGPPFRPFSPTVNVLMCHTSMHIIWKPLGKDAGNRRSTGTGMGERQWRDESTASAPANAVAVQNRQTPHEKNETNALSILVHISPYHWRRPERQMME
jgi:hypothetical protein